jgi:type II secretory ATPase GspE/PulE/Tfp pilus assembly ATPase PilB-like protein
LTSSVIAIMAQRPGTHEVGGRRICPACKVAERCTAELAERLDREPGAVLSREQGCGQCRSTGYQGRLAVFELMKLTEGLKRLIHRKESASTIRRLALEEGMVSLRQDAIRKVAATRRRPARRGSTCRDRRNRRRCPIHGLARRD